MGLLSWLVDRRVRNLEHEFQLLQKDVEIINVELATLRGRISVSQRKKTRAAEEDEPINYNNLSPDMQAFVSGLTPQEAERYFNSHPDGK